MPQAPKLTAQPEGEAASTAISRRIADLGDWRGATLARVRHLIQDADPSIQEEWKWAKPTSPQAFISSESKFFVDGASEYGAWHE